MIGIGVGVDYALIIVTRFREELVSGRSVEEAVARDTDTVGRAVIFAGAALLPALLGFAGHSIDRWRVGLLHVQSAEREGVWYRLETTVQRRPLLWAVAEVGVLLLTAPAPNLRLGVSDAGNNPRSFPSRRAYDLLTGGCGPGFNGPLLLAVELGDGRDDPTLDRLIESLAATDDVAFVAPPRFAPGGDAAVITVVSAGTPQDESTGDLIGRAPGRGDQRGRGRERGHRLCGWADRGLRR